MTTHKENGVTVLQADEGYTLERRHDDFDMGATVYLGIDYSTGKARPDKKEYYTEKLKEEEAELQ